MAEPRLLSGGNPQIAMGYGDAPVQAYIAAMPGWKRGVGLGLDRLIGQSVPGVVKAVKWNSPLYGIAGQGWFLGVRCLTACVKVTFFNGKLLQPVPPVASKSGDARSFTIRETEALDARQLVAWLGQACHLPGVNL